jgi:cobalt-zinc-cadmium efflux system membrane fusion protein
VKESIVQGAAPASLPTPDGPGPGRPATAPRRRRRWVLPALMVLLLLGGAAAVGLRLVNLDAARVSWRHLIRTWSPPTPHRAADRPATEPPPPWDGRVELDVEAQRGLGLKITVVRPQTEPIRLELLGTTAYDPTTLTRVRPLFAGRVDKVYVEVGQSVRTGDPLVDFYSTELAEAKGAYEVQRIRWVYSRDLLQAREQLRKSGAVSEQLYLETRSDEMKSRREYEVARDKLMVYGLTDEEIDRVERESGPEKARLTLRSPAGGVIVEREVVRGNLYDHDDVLLVISPMDHLWVWGYVFESDLDLVHQGQDWEIEFPTLNERLHGKIEYIANRVDPGTRAVRVRTAIPAQGGRLKADMLVRGRLMIPPQPGRTVIPRTALVVADGGDFVFVRSEDYPNKFERRRIDVVHEKDDHVVVETGLRPGEDVVTVGALVLAQMYENARVNATGAPPSGDAPGAG